MSVQLLRNRIGSLRELPARKSASVLLASVALVATGCGGDDNKDNDDSGNAPAPADTREEVIAESGNGKFNPAAIYERDAPGVVTVFSVLEGGSAGGEGRPPTTPPPGGREPSPLPEPDEGPRQGVGSGFVISEDGEIATNAHVVTDGEGEDIRKAKEVYIAFADGNEVPARIVGFDANSDVALLKIDPKGLDLRALKIGTTRELIVGSPVAAIGSPFGEPQSLSVGVVSATDRSIRSLTGFQISGAVQTDAAINRGNSGGPLVNSDGAVLGINSQIQTTSGGGEGVGYAVPADTVRRVIDALRKDGEIEYAFLGVASTKIYPQLAERFDLPVQNGAWVQEIVNDGPADKAGLRAGRRAVRFQARQVVNGGDIITKLEDKELEDEVALSRELEKYQPGDSVTMEVYRGDEKREIEVRLGERPEETE